MNHVELKTMKTIILGAGLAGISLVYFMKEKSTILEKEEQIGGLCRSFRLNNICYDIGPHILFSKNKEMLKLVNSIITTNRIKRSNKIFHNGKLIKYPFENDLSSLDAKERDYCLKAFLNNPHENNEAKTMLQFFLKTFGEGITNLYLRPYNEKIWKFDPNLMDTQIVDRIPKPPKEDIIKSAEGVETEGYTHQLYFYYPKKEGIQELISGFSKLIENKAKIINSVNIKKIHKENDIWKVETNKGIFSCERLINCMPLHELFKYIKRPQEITETINKLKYNSIHILCLQVKKENFGDNFAIYFADKKIIFHRVSKLNFLGEEYCFDNGSTLMIEITFRPGSHLASLSSDEIKKRAFDDLEKLNLVNKKDIIDSQLKSFKYAYVIYDLNHRRNTDIILKYLSSVGIICCGRFAEFEYLNMDQTIEHSIKLARELNNGELSE